MRALRPATNVGGATSIHAPVYGGWIWARAPDLLLGCGLGYVLLVPVLLWLAGELELRAWPVALVAAVTIFVSGPHYGATLLRAYEQREDRRKYALFTVWASLGLVAVTVAALHSVWLGSLLLTLYVSWSPWHFAGQNYGIALLFLRRRGVEIPLAAKRLVYASFVLSTVLAVVPLHTALPNVSYALEVSGRSTSYDVLRLGIPTAVAGPLLLAVAVAYLGSLGAAAAMLRRRAAWRDLAPSALLVASQALWFSIPGLVQGATSYPAGSTLVLIAIWINVAHAAQYLWITSHYARRDGTSAGLAAYLTRATLAGSAIGFVPAVLFAPALLGTVPYDAGLWVIIASVVNLHHFVLDGAIWKLRDGRVARVLLRQQAGREPPPAVRGRVWLRPALLALGALGLAVDLFDVAQRRVLADPALDLAAARAAAERLAWVGRESPKAHLALGRALAQQGDEQAALAEFGRSLALAPDAEAWSQLGELHERAGRLSEAVAAYEAAIGAAPRDRHALFRAGTVSAALAERAADPDERAAHLARAIGHWERLVALTPEDAGTARALARAYAEGGRVQQGLDLLDAAMATARRSEERVELLRAANTLRERLRP